MRYLLIFVMLVCAATPAQADWYRAESENFIVYMDDSERDVREWAMELERFAYALRRINSITAEPSPVKLRVFVVRSMTMVRSMIGHSRNSDTAGIYVPIARGPFAIVPERTGGRGRFAIDAEQVLFHEYAHHFMLQHFPANYPGWYVEGFAEFYGVTRVEDGNRFEIGLPAAGRAPDLHLGEWIPFETMLSNEAPSSGMIYAQAWLFTHYAFFDRETSALFRAYLNAMQQGVSTPDAYAQTFGIADVDYDRILQDYRDDGRMRGLALTFDDMPAFPVETRRISDAEAEVALLYARGPGHGLAVAEEVVRTYPNYAPAHVELARLQLEGGDVAGAIEAADRALALDPDHLEANLFKGIALTEAAVESGDGDSPHWAEARQYIARANRMDPDNALALYSYYQAHSDDSERTELVDQALEVAYSLVPQSPEVRAAMVQELINQERFELAARIIVPLLRTPHGAGGNPNAQAMLEQLRQMGRISNLQAEPPEPQGEPAAQEEER